MVPTRAACVPGASGWVEHIVQYGDTLSELAQQTGTQSGTVQQVNCITDDQLNVGQPILLPKILVVSERAFPAAKMIYQSSCQIYLFVNFVYILLGVTGLFGVIERFSHFLFP